MWEDRLLGVSVCLASTPCRARFIASHSNSHVLSLRQPERKRRFVKVSQSLFSGRWTVHDVLQHPAAARFDMSSVCFVGSGAAPLSADLTNQSLRIFPNIVFCQGYGVFGHLAAPLFTHFIVRIVGDHLPHDNGKCSGWLYCSAQEILKLTST